MVVVIVVVRCVLSQGVNDPGLAKAQDAFQESMPVFMDAIMKASAYDIHVRFRQGGREGGNVFQRQASPSSDCLSPRSYDRLPACLPTCRKP